MKSFSKTAEQEELVIDTVEGLVDFLVYAQDAYDDFKESAAVCPSQDVCLPYLTQAREAYETVQSMVERHCKVLDLGGFLSQDDVEDIQALYNKILSAKDDLESHLAVPQQEDILASNETQAPIDEADIDAYSHESYDEFEDDRAPRSFGATQAQGSLNITDESESAFAEVAIRQTSVDTETFRRNLKEVKMKTEALLAQGESMLHEYQAMSEAAEDDDDFKNGLYLYEQLKSCVAHLSQTKELVDVRTVATPTEDSEVFISRVNDELREFEKNLLLINSGLELFFEEPGSTTTVEAARPPEFSSYEEPKAANDNKVESFRPNLFSKNEMRPAIEKVISIPKYRHFLSEYFTSPGAFEAYLRREINTREKISKFDSVFGIIRKSPFDMLLRDKSLADLETFDAQPIEKIKQFLSQNDIQYEMYVDWMHAYDVMKKIVDTKPSMTFGELYVVAMVEELMDRETALAA